MPIPKNVPGGNSSRNPGGNNTGNRNRSGGLPNRPSADNPNRRNPQQGQRLPRNNPSGDPRENRISQQRQQGNPQKRQDPRNAEREQRLPRSSPRPYSHDEDTLISDGFDFEQPAERQRPSTSHVSEYDFRERSINQPPSRDTYSDENERYEYEPIVNEYDDEDDDTFTSISVDEQLSIEDEEDQRASRSQRRPEPEPEYEVKDDPFNKEFDEEPNIYDDDDEEEYVEEPEPAPQPKNNKSKKSKRGKKDKKGQDVFIDEKDEQIQPFGGKRKIKEHEYDRRMNIRKKAVIVQWVAISLLVVLVLLGVKNALIPPDVLTEQETADIAAATVGLTNYPLEEGKGFATDFMKAYLTVNSDDGLSDKVLGYYYSGSMAVGDSNYSNKEATSNYKQNILYGPTVYDAYAFTDYSARFTVGSLVKPSVVEGKDPGKEAHWEFFNVNVYYNSAADSFTITDDSPSVVPATDIGFISDLPERAPLGVGEADQALNTSIESVIFGYLQGYAQSSPTNHSAIDQYITDSKNPDLIKGLDGEYELSGDFADSVQFEAFPVDSEDNPTEIKALTKVTWANKITGLDSETRIDYTSTYVITLEKTGGKWLISKFQPQYYASEDAENPTLPENDSEGVADDSTEEDTTVTEE